MPETVEVPNFLSMGEAASKLSERLRVDGGGLRPEFEQPGTAEEAQPAAEEPQHDEAGSSQEEVETAIEEEAGTPETEEAETFELPETFNGLAEALGQEPSALYGLKFNIDIGDGESRQVTLEELKDMAKRPLASEAEQQRWLDQQKVRQAEIEAQAKDLMQRRQEADLLATTVFRGLDEQERALSEGYRALLQNVEYQNRDPQGYQVELLRHKARLEQIGGEKQALMGKMDQMRHRMAAEQEDRRQEMIVTNRKRAKEMIPAWDSDDAMNKGIERIEQYLQGPRFAVTPEEMATLLDARFYALVWDSIELQELKQKAQEQPRPKPTPSLRPGAQQVRLPQGRRQELEARKRLEETGTIDAAQAVLSAKLKQLRR